MDREPIADAAAAHCVQSDLGGGSRLSSLVEKLNAKAEPDPRPKPLANTVVDLDAALLLVLDAFDSARDRLANSLAILHEQLEVQRASGGRRAIRMQSHARKPQRRGLLLTSRVQSHHHIIVTCTWTCSRGTRRWLLHQCDQVVRLVAERCGRHRHLSRV